MSRRKWEESGMPRELTEGSRASWESSFHKAGKELRMIGSAGDVRLFSSGSPPSAWHAWSGDRRLYAGDSEKDAYEAFRKEAGEAWS